MARQALRDRRASPSDGREYAPGSRGAAYSAMPVSYTHLTLPTILLV